MLIHIYPCTSLKAFWYQLDILESIITFAEMKFTRESCVLKCIPMDKQHNPISARALVVIYNVCKLPNLDILATFLRPYRVSTQHPPNFHLASLLCLETFHPASTRYSTHIKLCYSSTSKAVVLHQTYACMFLNVYLYQNTSAPFTKH